MKKAVSVLLGIVLFIQSSLVFAQDSVISNPSWLASRAIRQLAGAERWLYRSNLQGAHFINDNFAQAAVLAHRWDPEALTYAVHVYFPAIDGSNCMFEFGSSNIKNKVYLVKCKDLQKQSLVGETKMVPNLDAGDLFDTPPVTLRRFFGYLMGSTDVLNEVKNRFQNKFLTNLSFDLYAPAGKFHWTVLLLARGENGNTTMKIIGNVSDLGQVLFSTL